METIKLDLIPGKKMPSLHASQYDDGREHGIDLFENGIAYKLDGTETLTINERKVDNNICSMDIENTFTGSSHIEFASFLQMCACAGSNFCELRISKGGVDIGTLNFILEVEPDPTADGIESESEIRNLKTQVEAITEEVIGDNYYTKTQTDDAIATAIEGKADTTYVDTELAKKADKTDTYTKTETNNLVSPKADKTYVDSVADTKADKATTYTKTEVDTLIDNLPEPMIFKGTLGVGGTIQTLPTASASNEGWTYKVITDGTYAGQTAKVGDVFTSNGSAWVLMPSGDTDTDTWRNIKVNGTEVLGNGISSGAVDFVGSENIEVDFDGNGNKVGVKTKNIYTKTEVDNVVSDAIYDILPSELTPTSPIANFSTTFELPIKSLEADVNAVQSAGTPTPSTHLPISGWNEIKISQAGKNLLSVNDVVFEQFEERSLQNPIPSGNYVFSGVFTSTDTDSTLCSVVFVDKDDNTIVTKSLSRNTRTSVSIDLSKDCYKIRFYASTSWPTSSGDTASFSDLQIELGSATEYEPYNGNTEVISLGETYYGGHFTQDKNGHRHFVVTHAKKKASDFNWYRGNMNTANTGRQFYIYFNNYPDYNSFKEMLCDSLLKNNTTNWNALSLHEFTAASNNYFVICVEDYASSAAMLADYGDMEFTVILKNPFTIDLPDGEPIITLNGTNNIYADTGDCAVEYKVSIEQYVSNHSGGGGAKSLGGVFLGGSNSGSEEEPTEESEETEKTKEIDEPKEEIKTIGDMKKLGGD